MLSSSPSSLVGTKRKYPLSPNKWVQISPTTNNASTKKRKISPPGTVGNVGETMKLLNVCKEDNQSKKTNVNYCLSLGINEDVIENLFDFSNFSHVIKKGGVHTFQSGGNGFITMVKHQMQLSENMGDSPKKSLSPAAAAAADQAVASPSKNEETYLATTIVKSSIESKPTDSLLYEGLVGTECINKLIRRFPCFVKTYGFYKYKLEGGGGGKGEGKGVRGKEILKNLKVAGDEEIDLNAIFDKLSPSKWDNKGFLETALEGINNNTYPSNLSIQVEYVHNPSELLSLISSRLKYVNVYYEEYTKLIKQRPYPLNFYKTLENNCKKHTHVPDVWMNIAATKYFIYTTLYQIYGVLNALNPSDNTDGFRHNDLHFSNVLVETLNKQYLTMVYHKKGKPYVKFNTKYICKMIDYGRSFVTEHVSRSSFSSMRFYKIIKGMHLPEASADDLLYCTMPSVDASKGVGAGDMTGMGSGSSVSTGSGSESSVSTGSGSGSESGSGSGSESSVVGGVLNKEMIMKGFQCFQTDPKYIGKAINVLEQKNRSVDLYGIVRLMIELTTYYMQDENDNGLEECLGFGLIVPFHLIMFNQTKKILSRFIESFIPLLYQNYKNVMDAHVLNHPETKDDAAKMLHSSMSVFQTANYLSFIGIFEQVNTILNPLEIKDTMTDTEKSEIRALNNHNHQEFMKTLKSYFDARQMPGAPAIVDIERIYRMFHMCAKHLSPDDTVSSIMSDITGQKLMTVKLVNKVIQSESFFMIRRNSYITNAVEDERFGATVNFIASSLKVLLEKHAIARFGSDKNIGELHIWLDNAAKEMEFIPAGI